jgi:hypothetical protein
VDMECFAILKPFWWGGGGGRGFHKVCGIVFYKLYLFVLSDFFLSIYTLMIK